ILEMLILALLDSKAGESRDRVNIVGLELQDFLLAESRETGDQRSPEQRIEGVVQRIDEDPRGKKIPGLVSPGKPLPVAFLATKCLQLLLCPDHAAHGIRRHVALLGRPDEEPLDLLLVAIDCCYLQALLL